MKNRFASKQSAFLVTRLLFAFCLCGAGLLLTILTLFASPAHETTSPASASKSDAPQVPSVGPGWSLITSPNITPTGAQDVACASPTVCFAVGNSYNGSVTISRTMIEQWNGSTWSVVPSPNTAPTQNNSLHGVACASGTQCFAVGEYQTGTGVQQALIERWNGTSWSIVSANTSTTQDNYLNQVTCNSAADCWAVGSINTGTVYLTLIVHWNGTAWSVVSSPNGSANNNGLIDVTCTSASDCWAVGDYSDGTILHTLVERWNGTSWSIVASPNTSPSEDNILIGVTCVSASDCWSVGVHKNATPVYQTLIEHWNGTAWSIVASPNTSASQDNILYSVKCVSSSDCSAIGYYFNGGLSQTLAQHWNGSAWTIVSSPNASPDNYLYGIACSSSSDCWAFGYFNTATVNQVLALRWNGASWSRFSSTNVGTTGTMQSNGLNGVTCLSPKECWSVGGYDNGGVQQTLIERWNGTSWAIINSPNTSTSQYNYLHGIACPSSTDCWAAGVYQNESGFYKTLIQRWNGSTWSIVASPNNGVATFNNLTDVACISGSDCSAVGWYLNVNGVNQTLVLRWNGSTWSIVSSPNSSDMQDNILNGVTCVAAECWAVGAYTPSGVDQVLVEKWNGSAWSIFPAPNTSPTQGNVLRDVACPAASQCFAVGHYSVGSLSRTLIEQWNGISASIIPSPNTDATHNNLLHGIACTSGSQCWAVGEYINISGIQQPLIEGWDGSAWTIAASNNNTAQPNYLVDVACASASNCSAVGSRNNGTLAQTVINQFALTTPPLSSVASRMTHGTVGKFDVDLPQTGPRGVECRSGGAGNDYTMIFTFPNNLTSVTSASVSGTGSITSSGLGPDPNQYMVSLTGVTNTHSATVTLNSVLDAENNTGNVPGTLNVLTGDTNGNATVNASDVAQTKGRLGQSLDATNFRSDININGSINASDVSLVKSRIGTALP